MRFIRGLSVAIPVLASQGCGPPPVTTTKPMFVGDTVTLKPGLWAILGVGCAAPSDNKVAGWQECAHPVEIEAHDLVLRTDGGAPFKFGLVASSGVPSILQVELHFRKKLGGKNADLVPSDKGGKRMYVYVSFTPDSNATVATSGMLRGLWCPDAPYPGIDEQPKSKDGARVGCEARNIEALRGMARDRVENVEPQRIVWIADRSAN